MNFPLYISRKIIRDKNFSKSVSAPIIKIAVSAITIGIVMMIVSVATGTGLQLKVREKLSAFEGHIQVTNFDNNHSNENVFPIQVDDPSLKNILHNKNISHIQPVATKNGMIRTKDAFEGILFKGVNNQFKWDYFKEYLVQGNIPSDFNKFPNQVLISETLANRLNLKLNDKFNTFFIKQSQGKLPNVRQFQIVGIFNSGFKEFDANVVIGNLAHIQRLNHWTEKQVGAIEFFIIDFDKIQYVTNQFYSAIGTQFDAAAITEKYPLIFEWIKLFDINILVILIVMILVATINMVVALLVLILERTQFIGILKSIGANNWTIRKIFIYNALHLIGKGLLYGNIIAITLLLLQKYFGIIKLNPDSYYVTQAPVNIDIPSIIALNLATVIICLIVLLIPSYLITKITPVKAIRFD